MANEKKRPDETGLNVGMPVRSEEIAYHPDELVECANCSRRNPPTRLRCLYCGTALEIPEERLAAVRPGLRRPEDGAAGFSVIICGGAGDTEAAAGLLKTGPEALDGLLGTGRPMPVARLESETEAKVVAARLREAGFEAEVLSDAELGGNEGPRRLRRAEPVADGLSLMIFGSDEVIVFKPLDLRMIVTGTIFRRTVESAENRRKGESKLLETSESVSDEAVIDLYAGDDRTGFRIAPHGFDFSCLGAEKSIVAGENMKRMVRMLAEFAPDAELVDDYLSFRQALGRVWEIEERNDTQGLTRQNFGKLALGRTSTSSNLNQFNRFSRLRRHYL